MFYRSLNSTKDYFDYFSVTQVSVDRKRMENALYGQMHVNLSLSNGQTVHHTFEADDWRKFTASFLKDGYVINP